MKILEKIRKVIETITAGLFAVLILIVLAQVFCRLSNIQQNWMDEISRFVFVWLTYMGGTIAISRGLNVTFDLFLESLHGKKFQVVYSIANVCCMAFLIIMLVAGAGNAWTNRIQLSPMTFTNLGVVYCAVPVGCLFMIISQTEYYIRRMKQAKEGC